MNNKELRRKVILKSVKINRIHGANKAREYFVSCLGKSENELKKEFSDE